MNSEWPHKLKVVPAGRFDDSTLSTANSVIDFCLVSFVLSESIVDLQYDKGLPWSLHFGLLVSLNGNLRQITAKVVSVP